MKSHAAIAFLVGAAAASALGAGCQCGQSGTPTGVVGDIVDRRPELPSSATSVAGDPEIFLAAN